MQTRMLLAAGLLLTGCGGGGDEGGSPGPQVPSAQVDGIYRGNVQSQVQGIQGVYFLVSKSGEAVAIFDNGYSYAANVPPLERFDFGFRLYDQDGEFFGTGSASAVVRERATIDGTFTIPSGTSQADQGTFHGEYDSDYDRPATLSDLVGTWSGPVQGRQFTVTFNADGSFFGQSSACSSNGNAIPLEAGHGLYRVTATTTCGNRTVNTAGLGFRNGTTDLHFATYNEFVSFAGRVIRQ